MMMRNLAVTLAVAGCSAAVGAEPEVGQIELTTGASKTLTLPGNPTTGFLWQVAEHPDGVQVTLAFEQSAPPSGHPVVGRPRATVVTLTAEKAGQGTLKLIYSRPWEKGKAPIDTRVYTITVK